MDNKMKENYENLEFSIVKEAIARNCSFSLGKEYIRNEYPHFNALWVQRELQRGKEALQLYNSYRAPSFGGISDISDTIKTIEKGGVVDPQELYQIATFIRACLGVKKYMSAATLKCESIRDLVDAISMQKKIAEAIENAISAAYEVKDSASSELKSIRRNIRLCEQEITSQTQTMISRYASILMENITATRNGRTCLLVKVSEKNKIRGYVHGESASGQAVYIEPEVLLRLNNRLQSLLSQEKEEVMRILRELCGLICSECHAFYSDVDTITILDALFAKAKWAFDRCGVYSEVNESSTTIYFKDARHPLIEESKVVSNTYCIKAPYRHMLITGSNTGGKTVTLKTIGLFSILTFAGFPVLCEEAHLPLLDGVFVDIGDSQSISESLSTFSAHVSKLAYITQHASEHSLVLLDELGSGTDPQEGECLAIATLDYFRAHNVTCIATTHYSKLKEYAKQKEDILLSSVAFDIEKMQPTYRFIEGYSGQSNALEIAARYHLTREILDVAYALKESNKSDVQKLMEKLEFDAMQLRQEKQQLQTQQTLLKEQMEALQKQQEQMLKQKDALLIEANAKAQQIIVDAQEKANVVIAQLKTMQSNVKEHELIAVKAKLKEVEEEEEEESVHTFALHDYVRLKTLGYHGEIVSIKGNRATVFANGMKMNVKTSDLEYTQRPNTKKVAQHSTKRSTTKSVSSECNLIGMRVEEALSLVDKYLDSALFAKMYTIRLVHGHGTGALRSAIHQYLKRNKHVESYRLGGEGEGGLGATVVTLKRGGKNG